VAGWAELVDGEDLGGIFSLFNVMDHYRDHFFHAGRVMSVHRRNLHLRPFWHVLLEHHHEVLRSLQGELVEGNVGKAVE